MWINFNFDEIEIDSYGFVPIKLLVDEEENYHKRILAFDSFPLLEFKLGKDDVEILRNKSHKDQRKLN